MFRNVFIFAGSLIGFLVSQSVSAQTPAAGTPPPSANPPPPPIADLTPVELPDRSRCNSPIDCVTCNNQPPAILTSAEYILVRPRRRENDYAIIDPTNNLTPEGSIRNVPFDTTGAFRVGAGYRPGGTPWEVMFTYMYLHDGNDRSAAAPPGGTLYATQTRPGLVDNVLFALGSNSLTMNVYDLETARQFQIDDTFTFRLGFGTRFADVDQTIRAFYFGGDANGAAVRSRVSFDGGGITVGGQGDWVVWRGIRLFGRGRASLLMADFSNHLTETDNGGRTVNANVREHYFQTVPVLELATGVAWEYRNLRVAVGYELQNWFNTVDSPTFVDDFAEGKLGRRKSDLGLEGIFVQLGLAF